MKKLLTVLLISLALVGMTGCSMFGTRTTISHAELNEEGKIVISKTILEDGKKTKEVTTVYDNFTEGAKVLEELGIQLSYGYIVKD